MHLRSFLKIVLIAVISLYAMLAVAAKPTKITPGNIGNDTAGNAYREYTVACSNGISHPVWQWQENKEWCVSYGSGRDLCWNKQIKAAKQICDSVIVIIVNPGSGILDLTKEQVNDIYLGKKTQFPDGSTVTPLDFAENSRLREKFYKALSQKNLDQLKAYWSRMIFTGQGNPPKMVQGSDELMEQVEENRSVIGYISSEVIDDSVKAVLVID